MSPESLSSGSTPPRSTSAPAAFYPRFDLGSALNGSFSPGVPPKPSSTPEQSTIGSNSPPTERRKRAKLTTYHRECAIQYPALREGHKHSVLREAHEYLQLLRDIARESDTKSDAADFIKCETHLMLSSLISRAQAGNPSAVEALARVALRATDALAELTNLAVEKRPDLLLPLRAVARTTQSWPHPMTAGEGQREVAMQRRKVLESLEVGRDTLTALNFERRVKSDDAIGKVAVKLLEYICDAAAYYKAQNNGRGALMMGKATVPQWAAKAAELVASTEDRLFTKDDAKAWWALAQPLFRESCSDPAEFPGLMSCIVKSKKRTTGLRFNFIEGKLARRFQSLAPKRR